MSLDLFGSELSTNAANFFNAGLKGRYQEIAIEDDHLLTNATYPVLRLVEGTFTETLEAALPALNMRLRDDYVRDCQRGVERWNQIISRQSIDYSLTLPHVAFNRRIGEFSRVYVSPDGELLDAAEWDARIGDYLPTADDEAYITSLMVSVTTPGAFASWIAPPARTIDNLPSDFEYVRIGY